MGRATYPQSDDFRLQNHTMKCFNFAMYLCFIDESGTPPKLSATNSRPYFVIAGVIIHEAQWHEIARELGQLRRKQEYRVLDEIKWRFFGNENQDRTNSVGHLDFAARNEFRHKFFDIIVKRRSIKIIGCVTHVPSAYKQKYVKNEEDLYFYTYKPVTERFAYFMQDVSREIGSRQLGIMVADHRGKKQDDSLRSGHHRLVEDEGVFTSKYSNYVETIFMTPSHLSIGIQFADMVAGALGRGFNSGDWAYFRQIRPAIRTSPDGQIVGHGIVKFPHGWNWEPPGGS